MCKDKDCNHNNDSETLTYIDMPIDMPEGYSLDSPQARTAGSACSCGGNGRYHDGYYCGPHVKTGNSRQWVRVWISQRVSGTTNTVTAYADYHSKYALRGSWPLRIYIEDSKVADKKLTVDEDNNNASCRSPVLSGSKSFTYNGSINVKIRAELYNFEYESVVTPGIIYPSSVVRAETTYTLQTTTVVPGGDPVISISKTGAAPLGSVYPGVQSDGSANYIDITSTCPSSTNTLTLYCQYKNRNTGWAWTNCSGFPTNVSGSHPTARRTFYLDERDSDRYSNAETEWRVWSRATSITGHYKDSGVIGFYVNDLPTMNGSMVVVDRTVATGAGYVKMTWEASSDSLANGKRYNVHLNKWNGSSYYYYKTLEVHSANEHALNLSEHGYARGEWCRLSVEPGDSLEWLGTAYGYKELRYNKLPTISGKITTDADSDTNKRTFKDSVTATVPPAGDIESGETATYYMYYRTGSSSDNLGSWVHYTSTTSRTSTLDASNKVSKGNYVQIGVIVGDGHENSSDSPVVVSSVLRRDNNPLMTSDIKVNPALQNGEVHYEQVQSFSWNAVNGQNGNPCTYRVGVEVRVNTSSGVHHTRSQNVSSTSVSWDISNLSQYPRSYLFRFFVVSIDQFGLESGQQWTRWFRKNRAPGKVPSGSFKVNSSNTNFYQSVPLKWAAASDEDGDPVTYNILFSKNRSAFTKIASGISALTYTHNISNLKAGDTLGYKIITVDKHGVESQEEVIEKCHSLVVNTPPNAPKILMPVSAVYDKKPRILFETMWDRDGDSLTVIATINGVTYNSATSPNNFNFSTYNGNAELNTGNKGVFIPNELKLGDNILKLKVFDGMQYSSEIETKINITTPLLSEISPTADIFISKDSYDKFATMINNIRTAYKISNYNFKAVTKDESFVTAIEYSTLLNKVCDVNTWIDSNYPGLNRPKAKPSVSKNNLISRGIYNSILDVITNL